MGRGGNQTQYDRSISWASKFLEQSCFWPQIRTQVPKCKDIFKSVVSEKIPALPTTKSYQKYTIKTTYWRIGYPLIKSKLGIWNNLNNALHSPNSMLEDYDRSMFHSSLCAKDCSSCNFSFNHHLFCLIINIWVQLPLVSDATKINVSKSIIFN